MFRILAILIKKEFLQIFRNKSILAIIFIMPIVQLIILPLAANYEIKDIFLAVVDQDQSSESRELLNKITASGYFKIVSFGQSYDQAYQKIEKDEADLIIEIPPKFEKNLMLQNSEKIAISINAINGTKAGLAASYLGRILQDYNQKLALEKHPEMETNLKNAGLKIVPNFWFNKNYNYRLSLVPGILAFLVTLIGGYLTALNIVQEKEVGTIEQINVSPVKKGYFILGKLLPFWILSMLAFSIGLVVTIFVYGIKMQGSFMLLYFFVAVYLMTLLAMGLLVSVYSQTQQQAMFMVFFFMMIFILMSGLFTPIESMTSWAKYIAYLNPVSYGVEGIRLIMLKNSSFRDLIPHFSFITILGIVMMSWAVFQYKKTS